MNDQGIRCPYCLEIFLNHKALSFHFVKYHFFIKKKTMCPICNEIFGDILDHVNKIHYNYCLYCVEWDPSFLHNGCTHHIRQGIQDYFKGKEISINSPGKK